MKYKIVDQFEISGRGTVILVEFKKPILRKDINLMGKKVKGQKIIGIELAGLGDCCYHKNAGLLIREKK